ncbi:MAG: hypothetical protein GX801_05010, partial [Fibrobacter sp.]|nr:hypothetical protein [Fibrobacter sp.]
TIALDQDSLLWGWGSNANGNLGEVGNPETEYYFLKPTLIDGERKWIKVWAGDETSYMQAVDGAIWGMGANHRALYRSLWDPVLEPLFLFQNPPLEMSVASDHYYAIDSDSLLRGWGYDRGNIIIPQKLSFDKRSERNDIGYRVEGDEWQWQTVGISEATSAALRTDGVIYWWRTTTHPLEYPNRYAVGTRAFGLEVVFDTLPPAQNPKDSADPTGISAAKPTLVAHIDSRTGILYASTSAPARIFSINGKMISTVQLHQGQAQLPPLPRGLYIIRLANGQSLKWRRE